MNRSRSLGLFLALLCGLIGPVQAFSPEHYQALSRRLDAMETSAIHPLFARHARSLRALIASEWARRELSGPGSKLDRTVREDLAKIAHGLDLGNDRWEAFRDAGQPLVIAFLSPRDQTLQFYHLVLPRDWKEDRTYPLYLELHGSAGDDSRPLGWAQMTLGVAPDFDQQQCPVHTYAMAARDGFHLLPYGRGDSGYEDIGETDIWEVLADAEATLRIDASRRYLYGFSMGGGGTFRLAAEKPELWAAIAIMGGSPGLSAAADTDAARLANLPIFMWCGEKDPWIKGAHFKAQILRNTGKRPREIVFDPKQGHAYLGEIQEQAHHFLAAQVRRAEAK